MLKRVGTFVFYKCLFRTKEYNKPDLSTGKYILCPNHTSDFDGPMFWSAHDNIRIMAKKECFSNPLLGAFLKKTNVVPVDRQSNPVKAISAAIRYLSQDEHSVFLMFPQGTISDINRNKLSRIKPGAFYIAERTNAKIVPVFIEQPRIFRRGRIVYGNPFTVEKDYDRDPLEGKYANYRRMWQEEIFHLEHEAVIIEDREVRTLKLKKKHQNNNE
ncbi:MAG: 1-acyl-sn-glycerol-3-phosphate acyltransferase [Firmicutes bacterium]|nr:1-acyl-sn-glycerol-3-phosphate acyltransferase [Bacillota bacterium]